MIHFRCGQCTAWLGAADDAAASVITCRRCGHANVCPEPSRSPIVPVVMVRRTTSVKWILSGLAVVIIASAAWTLAIGVGSSTDIRAATPLDPADARQRQILRDNAGKPGDPDLVLTYDTINQKHFDGKLPPMPVRWEPALADVGALAARKFMLEGMFGRVGKQAMILLNSSLRNDPSGMRCALCHEMVHAYFDAVGDESTYHGPKFKAVLRRLSEERAFEGIAATYAERRNLRVWLDTESARLDAERDHLDIVGEEITRERADLDKALTAFNERAKAPEGSDVSRPSVSEADALRARTESFNERVQDVNTRLARNREDLAVFNKEVARYNLMIVYPDGLDDEAPPVSAKRIGSN